jgi:hypothetical protein
MTDDRAPDLAAGITSGVVGGALSLTPAGPLVGAAAAAVTDAGVRAVMRGLSRRFAQRADHVLALAARRARLAPRELDERLAEIPGGEELLVRTLMAAASIAADDKLVALSLALARAATEGTETEVTFESQFVAAVADLGEAHWRVLQCFPLTHRELGLSMAKMPGEINVGELEYSLPWIVGLVDPVMPGLERHGLVALIQPEARSTLGPPRPEFRSRVWRITPFGSQALERFREVGALLTATAD